MKKYLVDVYEKDDHFVNRFRRHHENLTPDVVKKFKKTTEGFLIPPEFPSPIEFTGYKLREMETGKVLLEMSKPNDESDAVSTGLIRYDLTPEFLKIKTLGAMVEFKVGSVPIHGLQMIEKHFYRNELLIEFDFNFGFCIPNSVNTWEHVYDFPTLPRNILKGMIAEPYQTKSDSFYFANSNLIFHHKAEYSFTCR